MNGNLRSVIKMTSVAVSRSLFLPTFYTNPAKTCATYAQTHGQVSPLVSPVLASMPNENPHPWGSPADSTKLPHPLVTSCNPHQTCPTNTLLFPQILISQKMSENAQPSKSPKVQQKYFFGNDSTTEENAETLCCLQVSHNHKTGLLQIHESFGEFCRFLADLLTCNVAAPSQRDKKREK